jgi:ADP-ribose pyrophosphatase YjhB (NUDIX family)
MTAVGEQSEDVPWTRLAAHGLCLAADRLLVVRVAPPLADAGAWTIPGGGVDWGESPVDAVVREIREETGLPATTGGVAGVFSRTYMRSAERPHHSVHFVSIVFRAHVDAAHPLVNEVDGTTDLAAWISLDELADLPLSDLGRYALGLVQATHPGPAVSGCG